MLKRDLLLLPLIAVGTILLLILPAEWAFRAVYPSQLADACIATQANGVPHARPNCTSYLKASEGPWTANHYNACGYRTAEPCGPKPAGHLRVAVVGSSTGAGYAVPYADTMAARASAALGRRCGRPVEFQNLGVPGEQSKTMVPRAQEALGLDPDALLVVISPFDFELTADMKADNADDRTARTSPARRIKRAISSSRMLYMGSYFVLRDDGSYLPVYLGSGTNADFMRVPMPRRWQVAVDAFGKSLDKVAALAKAKGVPVTLLFVPQRAEAALVSSGERRRGFDPRQLPRMLAAIAAQDGVTFVDMLGHIPPRKATASIYYAVNGHINAQGHAIAAGALMESLTASGPFADACTRGR